MKKVQIDATEKKLGRLATEIANILMDKDNPDFQPHILTEVEVEVINASLMDISDKKKTEKQYERYSGYPGGRKVLKMKDVIEAKGYSEVLKKAVKGMLPKNKLQDKMLKRLKITD